MRRFLSPFIGLFVFLFAFSLDAKVKQLEPAIANVAHPYKLDSKSLHYVGWNQLRFLNDFPFAKYEVVKVNNEFGFHYFYVDQIEDYIKKDLRKGQSWEPHLTSLIKKYVKPGSVAVDVGAHIGTHTLELSKAVGEQGKVYAFEPQSKIFRELVMNMELNRAKNVEFFRVALASSSGRVELGHLDPTNEGGAMVGVPGTGQYVTQLPLDAIDLTNVSLIKIDVEGLELDVLKGALNTIRKNRPVLLIEILGGLLPEKGTDKEKQELSERIQFIEGLGYRVKRLNNHWDYLAIPIR